MEWDSESLKSEDTVKPPGNFEGEMRAQPSTPQSNRRVRLHEFVSKTVRVPPEWEAQPQRKLITLEEHFILSAHSLFAYISLLR